MKTKILQALIGFFLLVLGFALGAMLPKIVNQKKEEPAKQEESSETNSDLDQLTEETEDIYETYTVKEGDTLFGISLKFGVSVDELAKLNGLTDTDQIKAGQVLKIPQKGAPLSGSKIEVDMEKMKELQALINQGGQPWRLDPVEVVKAEAPASYEFNALDAYALKAKDIQKGEAEVEVKKTKEQRTYTYKVLLIQPIEKGEKGVWAITSVSEIK